MNKALKISNLVLFIVMIAVNALGNMIPKFLGSTSKISRNYPTLFTPAPITFAIWGVIYILIAIFAIYQISFGDSKEQAVALVKEIGPWFIVSCIMNIGWMISWNLDIIWLSLIFMIGLLASLILISMSFENVTELTALATVSRWGFDLYYGWICVATIANLSVLLVKIQWSGFGRSNQFWTITVLIVATVIGIMFSISKERYLSTLAIVWGFFGILIKHISQSGYAGQYPMIITTAIIGVVLMLSVMAVKAYNSAVEA